MSLLNEARVRGSVHSLPHVLALESDDCNVLLVSSRTLYVLQNLAQLDAGFETRYAAEYVDAGLYRSAETEAELEDVADVANNVVLEVSPVTCDLEASLNAIVGALGSLAGASCGCDVGTGEEIESGEEGGDPPSDVNGSPWDDPDPIVDRKCLASNYIHNSVRDAVRELDINRVDTYAYAGFAFMVTLVATVVLGIVAGPIGILAGAVIGSWIGMASLLLKGSVSLSDLYDAIIADEAAAICALFEASDADGARAAYEAVLSAGGASSIELEFAGWLLTNNVLDLLFFEWGDSAEAIENATVTHDCTDCCAPSEGIFITTYGTFDPEENVDGIQFTATAEDQGPEWRVQTKIDPPVGCPCVNYTVEVVSTTGDVGGTDSGGIERCNSTFSWRWNIDGYGSLVGVHEGDNILISGTGAFTVDLIISEQ